jgi:hypothetical protein
VPFAWDSIRSGTATVIVTEAEFKALAALQAFHAGELDAPTIGQPGLTVFRDHWAEELRRQGIEEVVLCYDSQTRAVQDGMASLTPEEQWSLRHGATCAAAGLCVRVARLPLLEGETKAEIDTFIQHNGAAAFQRIISTAVPLQEYQYSFARAVLERYNLPVVGDYPRLRNRPTRLNLAEAPARLEPSPATQPLSLTEVRSAIARQTEMHATSGEGLLVLTHPPGAGKGFNTARGMRAWMRQVPTTNDGGGFLVWTARRHAQRHDQPELELLPLAGRNRSNCRKLSEAQTLAQKGYSVKDALCMRRCPQVGHCSYLRQFTQEGDFFASTPLLQSTGWWEKAGVVVLDEFDPSSLIRHVTLSVADLAAMSRAQPRAPAIQTVLRWVAQVLATTTDRSLRGTLFLDELVRQANSEHADLDSTLQAALAELPPPEELNLLVGLPNGANLNDYQALPPGHTATLVQQIATEREHFLRGKSGTSRITAHGGRIELHLRIEHLIAQLARTDQPKIILDATANAQLLKAIFPKHRCGSSNRRSRVAHG